ncbi:MAG: PA2779 family protein, partial [Desulfobacterales bacterium]
MFAKTRFAKHVSCLMTLIIVLLSVPAHSVFAAMVGTDALLTDKPTVDARQKLRAILNRQDVQAAMVAHGIDPLEAKDRLESLSDGEIMQIAANLD